MDLKTRFESQLWRMNCQGFSTTMWHDMYLLRVKPVEQSFEAWDFYDLVATVPGDQAFPEG
jgi:hypothetical protein